jgi:hypothetical protein
LQLGIGIYDQALGGKTALVIGVEKPEAYHLLNDLLEAYEELYGEPLKRREPRDDLT